MGLESDPQAEAAAQSLVQEGEALLKDGRLSAALIKLEEAVELVSFRQVLQSSRQHGEARIAANSSRLSSLCWAGPRSAARRCCSVPSAWTRWADKRRPRWPTRS